MVRSTKASMPPATMRREAVCATRSCWRAIHPVAASVAAISRTTATIASESCRENTADTRRVLAPPVPPARKPLSECDQVPQGLWLDRESQ